MFRLQTQSFILVIVVVIALVCWQIECSFLLANWIEIATTMVLHKYNFSPGLYMVIDPVRSDTSAGDLLGSAMVKDGPGQYNSDCELVWTRIREADIPGMKFYAVVAYPDPTFDKQAVVINLSELTESTQARLEQVVVKTPGFTDDWQSLVGIMISTQGDYENRWTGPDDI